MPEFNNRFSDEAIAGFVKAATAGDEQAWAELDRSQSRLVWWVIRTYRVPDASAADVFQMVWLRLLQNIDRIRDARCLSGWLATNHEAGVPGGLRRAARLRPDPTVRDLVAEDSRSPEALCVRRDRDRLIRQAFARLPERDRLLLRIVAAEPRPDYRRVAEVMGMPVGSIGPTRARVLARLRRELFKLGVTDYG